MMNPGEDKGPGRRRRPSEDASGEEKPKRKPAARKPTTGGAAPAPRKRTPGSSPTARKPRNPKPKPATDSPAAKPRTPRKKPAETDQLPLTLDSATPIKPSAPPRRAASSSSAASRQVSAPPAAETVAATPAAARPKRPAPPPAVRVVLPSKFSWRDLIPHREPRAPAEPKPPLPLVERVLNWLRNASTVAVVLGSLLVMWAAAYALVDPPRTPLMWVRYWQGLDGDRFSFVWKPFDDLGDETLQATMAAVDPAFLDLGGLHPSAIKETLKKEGLSGVHPTTLSKLVSRNLFSWPSNSTLSGLSESFFRVVIDVSWSKRRILEVYANIAEFGPGLYGAEAAAQAWFAKPAKDLTHEEAALLAACLANPQNANLSAPPAELLSRRDLLLQRMQTLGDPSHLHDVLPAPKDKR
jgi:monofunctional biosynthetic peptidoglycan transglycosylase